MAPEPFELTFLFTDIEGSTRLWERHGAALGPVLAWHDALAADCVRAHRGELVKRTGDGLHAAFNDPADALQAAVDLQIGLQQAPPPGLPVPPDTWPLQVRCGLHRGPSEARDGDYYGPVLNRAARIMGVAHGGQVLLSQAVLDALPQPLPGGARADDLGPVRLRDLAQPERLHQLVHPALRAQFPPLRSLAATPNNLPQQLNAFVGREAEVAELRGLLQRARLVTLLGMGGIGKSRLSVQLGAELLDRYPDGVWLVELAPLADERLVPQAVATVLGLREAPGQTVLDALVAHLRERRLLILLDNCEHLAPACAALAKRLLQAAPDVAVLASSRDALQVAGETVYPLAPLAVPQATTGAGGDFGRHVGASDSAGAAVSAVTRPDPLAATNQGAADAAAALLGRHAAVQLFVDRATAANARFRLTPANGAAVAEICRRLDGIPLALELAAARTRAMPVETLAARLGDRFDFALIASGDSTMPARQRTLRALIDWSHDLLDEPERRVFRRLAVFAGGWTLEAAEAVCAGDGLDAADVFEPLAQLVGKSLVLMDADSGRYRMLETVRRYAAERLAEAGEAEAWPARHLAHVVALAEAARAELAGPDQARWLARLDTERDNLLAAHAWNRRSGHDDGLAVRLLHALRPYWFSRGALSLVYDMARDVLARPGLAVRDRSRCMALFAAGQVGFLMGRHAEAEAALTECLAIARELGDEGIVAHTLQPLGMNALARRDFPAAERHLADAVALARVQGDARGLAAALNAEGMLHRLQHRLDQAAPLCAQVVQLFRAQGDLDSIGIALLNQAMVALLAGDAAQARPLLAETVSLVRATGSQPMLAGLLDACAGLAHAAHDAGWALALQTCAEEHRLRTAQRRDPADEEFLRLMAVQAGATDAGYAMQPPGPLPHSDTAHGEALLGALEAWLGGADSTPTASGPLTSS